MPRIEVGDVITDNLGREGVVVREEAFPGTKWAAAQSDERVALLDRDERWLGVLPFCGGLVVSPESLSKRLRAAEKEDFLRAVEAANEHGVRYLVAAFPEWAADSLAARYR